MTVIRGADLLNSFAVLLVVDEDRGGPVLRLAFVQRR